LYAINSALRTFDEIVYVDWASEGRSLVEEIKNDLIDKSRFKFVNISTKQASAWTKQYSNPQKCVEVLGRNIGLRRLSTNYLASTNPDIIQPHRSHLERYVSKNIFNTAGKRTISLFEIRKLGNIADDISAKLVSMESTYGQQPTVGVCEGDIWSLVSGCGDFQIAHRDIWYAIKGFEETLVGRGFADSNVQKKAWMAGFKIDIDWNIPVWHIGHEGGMGGSGDMNNPEVALRNFTQSTNSETWGFSNDRSLKLKTL
jgi:hypothetical protein